MSQLSGNFVAGYLVREFLVPASNAIQSGLLGSVLSGCAVRAGFDCPAGLVTKCSFPAANVDAVLSTRDGDTLTATW